MIVKKGFLLCCICFSMCLLSCNHNNEVGVQDVTKDTVTSKTVPTVCLYTLGNVSKKVHPENGAHPIYLGESFLIL